MMVSVMQVGEMDGSVSAYSGVQVAKWYRSAGEACTSMVPESAAVAHDCWVKKFAEVSMLWREHGVVKGTLTVFGEMGDIIKGAAKRGEV